MSAGETQEASDAATRIYNAVQAMESMVDAVLSLCRLNRKPLQRRATEVQSVVTTALSALTAEIEQVGAKIEVAPDLPVERSFSTHDWNMRDGGLSTSGPPSWPTCP